MIVEEQSDMGGVQHSTLLLAKNLSKLNYISSTILLPSKGMMSSAFDNASIKYILYNKIKYSSTSISLVNDRIRIINPFSYIFNIVAIILNALSIRAILKIHYADIVLTKGLGNHFSCSLACKMMNKKVIWHLQDLISDRYFGILQFIINMAANVLADFVICDGQLIKDSLRGKAYENSKVVFNGVSVGDFKMSDNSRFLTRSELNIPQQAYVIGNVARFTPWKGQRYLVEAFIEYSKLNNNAFLLLVGSPLFDNGAYYNELQELVKINQITDRVIMPGYRTDLQNIFSSIDLFAYPSIEKDTTPLSLISALSSGLSTVVSNIPSLHEVVSRFKYVKTFEPNNTQKLISLFQEYENIDTRKSHGINNHINAKKYFAIETHTKEMLNILLKNN